MVDSYEQQLAYVQQQQNTINENRAIAQQQAQQLSANIEATNAALRQAQTPLARSQILNYGQNVMAQQGGLAQYSKSLRQPEQQLQQYKSELEKSNLDYQQQLKDYQKAQQESNVSNPAYLKALKEYNKSIQEQKDWNLAEKLEANNVPPFFQSNSVQEKWRAIHSNRQAGESKSQAWMQLTDLEKQFGVKIKPEGGWENFTITKPSGEKVSVSAEHLGEQLQKSQTPLGFNPKTNPYVFTSQATSKEEKIPFFEVPQYYIQKGINYIGNVVDTGRGAFTNIINAQAQRTGIPKQALPIALSALAPQTSFISPIKQSNELIPTSTKLDVATYFIPYVGETRFLGTDIPAFASKAISSKGEYIKQNPIESALTIGGLALMGGSEVLSEISKTAKPGAEIGFVKLSESSQPLEKVRMNGGDILIPSTKEFTPQTLDFYGAQKVQYKNPLAFLGAKPIEIIRPIKIPEAQVGFAETTKNGLITFEKPFESTLPKGYELTRLKIIGNEADTLKDITQIHPKVNQQAFEDAFLRSEKAQQFAKITGETGIVGTKSPEYISYLKATKPLEYKDILGFTRKVSPEKLKITTGKALAYDSERMFGFKMGHVGEETTTPFAMTFPRKTTTVSPLSIIEKTFPNEFKQYGVRAYDLGKALEKGKEAQAFPIKYFINYQEKPFYTEYKGTTKTPLISSLLKTPEKFEFKNEFPPKGELGNLRKGQFEKLEIIPRPSFNPQALATSSGIAVEELTGAIPKTSFDFPNVAPAGASFIRTPQVITPKINLIEMPINRPINRPIELLKPIPITKPINFIRPINVPKDIIRNIPIQHPIQSPISIPIQHPIQSPISIPLQIPVITPVQTSVTTPQITPIITPIIIPPVLPNSSGWRRKKESFIKGYKTLVRRHRKWFELPGIEPRQEAIQKGEKIALGTLAASFSIKPTSKFIEGSEIPYEPSNIAFRNYIIRGNQRIPQANLWIQKSGSAKEGITVRGARLASYGERQEIKSLRLKSNILNSGRTNVKRTKSPFF